MPDSSASSGAGRSRLVFLRRLAMSSGGFWLSMRVVLHRLAPVIGDVTPMLLGI